MASYHCIGGHHFVDPLHTNRLFILHSADQCTTSARGQEPGEEVGGMHPCFRVARSWRLACCDAVHASGRRSIYSGAYSSSRHSNRTPPQRTCHGEGRSEEHTSELQSLMRISYAVFCLKKKKTKHTYK